MKITKKPAELDEGSVRMIENGWELHTGPIYEEDIKTHDFCIMGNCTFKKLKDGENGE